MRSFTLPSRFFLIFATIFGSLFVFLTPPFQGPDEPVHFLRAYQISDGVFKPHQLSNGMTATLPKSLGQTIGMTFGQPEIRFDSNKKFEEGKIKRALRIPLNESDRKDYSVAATAPYSPISYLPQSFAMFIGKLFNAPPILLMYMARLANVAVWVAIIWCAIRLIPVARWGVTVVALLPMAVFQSAVITTDAVATGSLALFVAAILWAAKRPIAPDKKVWAILLGTGLLLALSKQVMFLFLLLLVLLPVISKRFRGWRSILAVGACGGVAAGAAAGWLLLTSDINVVAAAAANSPMPGDQLRNILHDPWGYVVVLWNTYFFTWGDSIVRSAIGTFGWADTPMALPFVIMGYTAVIVSVIHAQDSKVFKISRNAKMITAGIIFLYLLAVSTALYLYYTPVGFEIIVGIQGRYFLPALLLATLLGVGSRTKFSKGQSTFFIIAMPLLLLVAASIYILFRYYLYTV